VGVVTFCFKVLRTYCGILFKNLTQIPETPSEDSLTPGPGSNRYEIEVLIVTVTLLLLASHQ
jgi:hypothetical protein